MATANPRAVISAEDRTSEVLRRIGASFKDVDAQAGKFFATLRGGGVLGGALAFATIAVGIKQTLDQLDALDERAQTLALPPDFLSAVDLSARRSGVESIDQALNKFNQTLEASRTGSREATEALKALGVDTRALRAGTLSTAEALRQAADGVAGYRNGFEKSALVADVFGSKQAKLITLLNGGRDALTAFGGASEEQVRNGARLAGEIDKLSASWERLKLAVVGSTAGFINSLLDESKLNRSEQVLGRLEKQIERLRKQLAGRLNEETRSAIAIELEELTAKADGLRQALEQAGLDRFVRGSNAVRGAGVLPAAPVRTPAVTLKATELTDAQRALSAYVEQLARVSDKLAEIEEKEKVLQFLQANPSVDTPQVRELLFALAERNDELEREAAIRKELAQIQREELAATRALDGQLDDFSGRAEIARKQALTARLEARLAAGEVFSAEELDRIVKGIGGIRDEVEKTDDVARQLGLTFTSAFEDAIVEGRNLRDVLDGIFQDLLRLTTRKLVTEPISDSLTGLLKGLGSGGGGVGGGKVGEGLDQLLYRGFTALFGGGFASGGFLPPGRWGVVGERGPEIAFGGRGGQTITPMSAIGGPTINVMLPAGAPVTAQTANQFAAGIARKLMLANARLN